MTPFEEACDILWEVVLNQQDTGIVATGDARSKA